MDRKVLRGVGVSGGVAVAPAVVVTRFVGVDPDELPPSDITAASVRIKEVLADVSASLLTLAESTSGSARDVVSATAHMATDRALFKAVDAQLDAGAGVTHSVYEAIEVYAARLRSAGGYVAQRVTDLYDIRDRALARLRDLPEPGVPELTEPSIVVASDVSPAELLSADTSLVRGIVVATGGVTSHTSIVAAQRGIPAVVQVEHAVELVHSGQELLINGDTGEVLLSPADSDVQEITQRELRRIRVARESQGPGSTRDGHPVPLLVNIASPAEASSAAAQEAEGAGLVRTEFLFADRATAPSVSEQTATYTAILKAFGRRPVLVRALDAGGDKPLEFASPELGPNPALGQRGIRFLMQHEEILTTQLQALARAQQNTQANLQVMAPMITTVEETEWFLSQARAHGLPSVGITVETPAAAIQARQLLATADFAALGTNDLTQYTMAADRLSSADPSLLSPWQPAVLSLAQLTCQAAKEARIQLSVCGESAADPLYALVLVGMGVTALSMAPRSLPLVRATLRLHDVDTCTAMAEEALAAPTAKHARTAVRALAHPDMADLL